MAISQRDSARKHFFILGAPKTGTTSLHYYLTQHQGIQFPVVKEPLFFEAEFERGLNYYHQHYFPASRPGDLLCDARPINLFLPFVPGRIAQSLPDAKLVVVLRDPVDRAYSHWWMRWCKARESLTFDEAIERNLANKELMGTLAGREGPSLWKQSLATDSGESNLRIYVEIGQYEEQLTRYLSHFSQDQLLVISSRSLQADPRSTVSKVCEFLDLPDFEKSPDLAAQNTGESRGRSKMVSSAYKAGLSRLAPKPVKRIVRKLLMPEVKRPLMSDDAAKKLRQHYEPHEAALKKLLRELNTIGF